MIRDNLLTYETNINLYQKCKICDYPNHFSYDCPELRFKTVKSYLLAK